MQPSRIVALVPAQPLFALTATARGMIEGHFVRAAQRAYTELMSAIAAAGSLADVRSLVAFIPDTPVGPNDASCRFVAGVLFGRDLLSQQGDAIRPEVPLTGSLAWRTLEPGRYAVFEHRGPLDGLQHTWDAVYREWLPSSHEQLRQGVAPMELSPYTPALGRPDEPGTEIWIPLI